MLKLSLKHRRNMNIHLYSIKLLRNNFITHLFLYKSLNYESSSMRNDYILFKNNVIVFVKKLRSRYNKKKIKRIKRSYRTLRHRQAL